RHVGLSPFSAFQFTVVLMTLLGFAGMMLFLRWLLQVAVPIALAGSAAFAGSSVLYQTMTNGHTQLQNSLWVPYLSCLILLYLRTGNSPSTRRTLLGAGLVVMTAALLYTSFPIGWFGLLQLLVAMGVLLVGDIWREGARAAVLRGYAWLKNGWGHLL